MSGPQNNLKEVLRKIQEIQKSAELTGENFNVFSILDRERKEVTTHSAIIAELLNPHGSHGQETLFLKLFLKQLQATILNSSSESSGCLKSFLERLKPTIDASNELTGFKVRTEKFIFGPEEEEKGFLDIVIESDDVYIVIENKIDTEDAERQLEKYCNHIKEIKKDTKVLLYLTPEGKGPNNLTLCDKGEVALEYLSYKDFIIKWLDKCITKVSNFPRIWETLHQYQMIVRKLTGRLPSKIEDALNKYILEEKSEELKRKILEELQHKLQCEFWKELKEQLVEEKLVDKNSKFQLYKSVNDYKEIPDEELGRYIGHNFLGLTFSIRNGLLYGGKYKVAFRVDYQKTPNYHCFNYGFVFCTKDTLQKVNIEQYKGDLEQYMRLEHPHEKNKPSHGQDGWLSWKYFQYEREFVVFITESKETLIRKLISEIKLALSKARQ